MGDWPTGRGRRAGARTTRHPWKAPCHASKAVPHALTVALTEGVDPRRAFR